MFAAKVTQASELDKAIQDAVRAVQNGQSASTYRSRALLVQTYSQPSPPQLDRATDSTIFHWMTTIPETCSYTGVPQSRSYWYVTDGLRLPLLLVFIRS